MRDGKTGVEAPAAESIVDHVLRVVIALGRHDGQPEARVDIAKDADACINRMYTWTISHAEGQIKYYSKKASFLNTQTNQIWK